MEFFEVQIRGAVVGILILITILIFRNIYPKSNSYPIMSVAISLGCLVVATSSSFPSHMEYTALFFISVGLLTPLALLWLSSKIFIDKGLV